MKVSPNIITENYKTVLNKKYFLQNHHSLREFKLLSICYKQLFLTFEKIDLAEDPLEIESLRLRIMHFENRIQRFWGFAPNYDYHIWWAEPKSCNCSYTKNRNQSTIKNYSPTCKIHRRLI